MRTKSVVSSCAVIVLSAVLSTGWAITTPDLSGMQSAINNASSAANSAANQQNQNNNEVTPEKPSTDTNKVMKTNEAELVDAQEDATKTIDGTTSLQGLIGDGVVQAGPAEAYAADVAGKLAEAQKKFCAALPATVTETFTSNMSYYAGPDAIGPAYCSSYLESPWVAISAQAQNLSPYCYVYDRGTKTVFWGMYLTSVYCKKITW